MARQRITSISVGDFFRNYRHHLQLELVGSKQGLDQLITEPTVNRPGLALSGYLDNFAHRRVQVIGTAEFTYLDSLGPDESLKRLEAILSSNIPCLVFSYDAQLPQSFLDAAARYGVATFTTKLTTIKFISYATFKLEKTFAESTSLHGCMVDIRGIGVLIRGRSGLGKSEAALGILERGGSLISDDLVRVHNFSGSLIGSGPDFARGSLEMRGIGIVNVVTLFGMSAIRLEKQLDLVVSLRPEKDLNNVDRLGVKRQTVNILGIEVPHIEIPVAPGRDIARLVEVAALDQRLKGLGYDMAGEFNRRLMERMNPDNIKDSSLF